MTKDTTSEPYTARLGYRAELDGLRAFAVLAVIAFHYLEERYLEGGFLGVDLFFVLSGFLITRLLLEERAAEARVDLPAFYVRRGARLLPAALLLCFVAIVDALTMQSLGGIGKTLFGVAGVLGYFTNWARVFGYDSAFGHTWSLSVEEQFYIVWPVVLIVLHRWGSVRAVRIGAAVVVTVSAVQMAVRSLHGVSADVLYNATDAHGAAMLVAGCLLATVMPVGEALHHHPFGRLSRLGTPFVLAALAICAVGVPVFSSFYYRGGFVLVAVLFGLLIARALQPGALARVVSIAPIVWIGRVSYGLYLWHYPVWFALRTRAPSLSDTTLAIMALLATFGAATASFYVVEMPIRQAAVHLRRRRSNAAPILIDDAESVDPLGEHGRAPIPRVAEVSSHPEPARRVARLMFSLRRTESTTSRTGT